MEDSYQKCNAGVFDCSFYNYCKLNSYLKFIKRVIFLKEINFAKNEYQSFFVIISGNIVIKIINMLQLTLDNILKMHYILKEE